MIFWLSSPVTRLPWWTGRKKKRKKKLCSTTSVRKESRSLFPLLPVFHWTKNVSSTSAICSCNSYAPNCASTTSAEISVTTTGLLTISMPSLRIWSMPGFFPLPASSAVSLTASPYWNRQSIPCRIFIVPFLFSQRNPITFRRSFTKTPTLSILVTQKSFTMTVPTIILRLKPKMAWKSMAKARNTDPIPSWPWDCSWMQTASHFPLICIPEIRTNSLPWNR